MKYKILYAFKNNLAVLVEVKRLDLPENATLDEKYHWLFANKVSCHKLMFESMQKEPEQIRVFNEGVLSFDDKKAIYTLNKNSDDTVEFESIEASNIHPDFILEIEKKLKELEEQSKEKST